jgi:nitrate reductase gamma subunit
MSLFAAFVAIIVLSVIPLAGAGFLGFHFLFAIIIPYTALLLFISGFIYRVLQWGRSPVPFHVPAVGGQQKSLSWIRQDRIESPSGIGGVLARMALEVLLFRSLFRNDKTELSGSGRVLYSGNRFLWLAALIFHWSLVVILVRHLRLFLEPVPGLVAVLDTLDGLFQVGLPPLYLTDVLILLALVYLSLRRIVDAQVRYISLPSDYFALLLILGIVISGVIMRHFLKVDILEVKKTVLGLLSFSPALPRTLGSVFYLHLFLISVLLAYFPFSKLMHMGGIFFSPTRNLANNSRMRRHVNPWDHPVKVHTYEEYEDDFREAMKEVGLPVEKE